MTSSATAGPSNPPAEVVRISTPVEIAATIPFLLGFHPAESIVLLCLRGSRSRVGPVLRQDIPRGRAAISHISSFFAEQAVRFATAVTVLCYTEEPDGVLGGRPAFPDTALVRGLLAALRRAGVPVVDAMLVRGGLGWSYLHHSPMTPGYPLIDPEDPVVEKLSVAHVSVGRVVLADRAAVAATIAGPTGAAAAEPTELILAGLDRFATTVADLDYQQTVAAGCRIAAAAVESCWTDHQHRHRLPPAAAGELIAVTLDPNVRDALISWGLQRAAEDPLPLFMALAQWTPDELAAQVCAALAVIAYRSGDGALAQLALDRVLTAEPDHRLGKLLISMFSAGIEPAELDLLILEWSEHPANPAAPRWRQLPTLDDRQDQRA